MHAYRLTYDDGYEHVVRAHTPSVAVARRGRTALPSGMTDLTVMAEFKASMGRRGYGRITGPIEPLEARVLTWLERMGGAR